MSTAAGSCELSRYAENNPKALSDQMLKSKPINTEYTVQKGKVYAMCELSPFKALIKLHVMF